MINHPGLGAPAIARASICVIIWLSLLSHVAPPPATAQVRQTILVGPDVEPGPINFTRVDGRGWSAEARIEFSSVASGVTHDCELSLPPGLSTDHITVVDYEEPDAPVLSWSSDRITTEFARFRVVGLIASDESPPGSWSIVLTCSPPDGGGRSPFTDTIPLFLPSDAPGTLPGPPSRENDVEPTPQSGRAWLPLLAGMLVGALVMFILGALRVVDFSEPHDGRRVGEAGSASKMYREPGDAGGFVADRLSLTTTLKTLEKAVAELKHVPQNVDRVTTDLHELRRVVGSIPNEVRDALASVDNAVRSLRSTMEADVKRVREDVAERVGRLESRMNELRRGLEAELTVRVAGAQLAVSTDGSTSGIIDEFLKTVERIGESEIRDAVRAAEETRARVESVISAVRMAEVGSGGEGAAEVEVEADQPAKDFLAKATAACSWLTTLSSELGVGFLPFQVRHRIKQPSSSALHEQIVRALLRTLEHGADLSVAIEAAFDDLIKSSLQPALERANGSRWDDPHPPWLTQLLDALGVNESSEAALAKVTKFGDDAAGSRVLPREHETSGGNPYGVTVQRVRAPGFMYDDVVVLKALVEVG